MHMVCEDVLQLLDERHRPRVGLAVLRDEQEGAGDSSLDADPRPAAVRVDGM